MAPKNRKKKAHAQTLQCFCDGHCPDNLVNGTCETRPGGSCFASVEEVMDEITGYLVPERTYGCMPPEQSGGFLQCKIATVPQLHGKNIQCCDGEDFCNKNLLPKYTQRTTPAPPISPIDETSIHYLALIISILVCFSAFLFVISVVYVTYKRKERRRKNCIMDSDYESHLSPLAKLVEQSSGSGRGIPTLVQRTIAKQIQMQHSVGKGRYGEVWLGKFRDERVAVKIFFTTEESSWHRETSIYQTVLMRHENILGFIAADVKGTGSWTQMLLITDYHELGSLHDYLLRNAVEPHILKVMAFSLASGLEHLHKEIFGSGPFVKGKIGDRDLKNNNLLDKRIEKFVSEDKQIEKPSFNESGQGKPAIAHRDIKSKNILVKRNGQCAIADFGLAVKYKSEDDEIDTGNDNTRLGTRRYMPPELLNGTFKSTQFESYKMADMYSVSLCFWEMSRRCITTIRGTKNTTFEDYALPYHDVVPSDPSLEDMKAVVCTKGIRPPIPARWHDEEILVVLSKIIQECWHSNPDVRLTALRVKKSLGKLQPDGSIKIV